MKNHFIIAYTGNKRQEVEHIHAHIDSRLATTKTIIEPFCGSSAMSYYIATLYPGRFNYVLNDCDEKLIELYKLMQDAAAFSKFTAEINETVQTIVDKDAYLRIVKQDTLMGWMIKHLIYKIKPGLYRPEYTPKIYDFSKCGIVQFLRTEKVEMRCGDGCDVLQEFKDDMSCLMLVDPPYMVSDNSFYSKGCRGTNIYEHCGDNSIADMQAGVVFIVDNNWIMRVVFKGCLKNSYDKSYSSRYEKKKTQHIIISNL